VIGIAIYNHLFEQWHSVFACFGQSRPSSG